MSDGHPKQDAVAAKREPMDAWRGIVDLCANDNVSQINVAGISRRKAIFMVNGIVNRLARIDPYDDETCHFCHRYEGTPHAPDCIWLAAQAAKE